MTGLLHKPKNSARQWASKEQAASLLGADTFCQRILATSLLNGMARLMRCITDWKHLIAIIFITSTFKLHQPIPSRPSLPTPIRPGSWQTLYTCWKIPHHFIRALYSLLLLPQPLLAAFFKTQRRSISLITVFFYDINVSLTQTLAGFLSQSHLDPRSSLLTFPHQTFSLFYREIGELLLAWMPLKGHSIQGRKRKLLRSFYYRSCPTFKELQVTGLAQLLSSTGTQTLLSILGGGRGSNRQ